MTRLILRRYVMRLCAVAMAAGVLGLLLLQWVFGFLGELQNINRGAPAMQVVQNLLLDLPERLLTFMPTGVLLGAVVALSILAANGELTVMRAAGVSLSRLISWVLAPVLLFAAFGLFVAEWGVPLGRSAADKTQFWLLVDGAAAGELDGVKNNPDSFIANLSPTVSPAMRQIVRLDEANGQLSVKNYAFLHSPSGDKITFTTAPNAVHLDGYRWQLYDAQTLTVQGRATLSHSAVLDLMLPVDNQAALLTRDPERLSLSQLVVHKRLFAHQNRRALRHEGIFWQRMLLPLALAAQVLLASSFVFGSLRTQTLGFKVVVSLLVGVIFNYLTQLFGFMAVAFAWSPFVMAILPSVIGMGVGGWLLARRG